MKGYQIVADRKSQTTSNSVASHVAGNKSAIQLTDNRQGLAQRKQVEAMADGSPAQGKANNTGLPEQLKSGVENLSGHSLDDVKVHYNSDKPAQLNAHAYAQGTDIHLAPGQEKHLPHEAWHVVQQKQGRVQPTVQMKGTVNINDNKALAKESDVKGHKALRIRNITTAKDIASNGYVIQRSKNRNDVVQRISDEDIERNLAEIDENRDFNIGKFLTWQRQIAKLKPGYRTMGPEFEFAKLAADVPLHVELGKSTIQINGLPFVIETDAGNVIELACPPFVIGTTLENWEKAKLRSMIITNRFEKLLKGTAEIGATSGKNLQWLLLLLKVIFGTGFDVNAEAYKIRTVKLVPFTKGLKAYSNEFVGEDMVTNAQINIKMTTSQLARALRKATKGSTSHQFLKGKVNFELLNELRQHAMPGKMNQYRNRVAIISYYVSQIPLMALQYIMNVVRDQHKTEHDEDKVKNRDAFKASHPANQKLLVKLSGIKDFMGFWVKASLNDMMKTDPGIKPMVLAIDPMKTILLLIGNSINLWSIHKEGFEKYAGGDLTGLYGKTITNIFYNMRDLARTVGVIKKPHKLEFPLYTSDRRNPNELLDYVHGAPFMARPDTYVPLQGGHLVEVRGLNKKIADNKFMRGFQMPFYRSFGVLASEKSLNPYKKEDADMLKRFIAARRHIDQGIGTYKPADMGQ